MYQRIRKTAKRRLSGILAIRLGKFGRGFIARVVEWQTRKHEGLMPKGVGVQLPPRALIHKCEGVTYGENSRWQCEKSKLYLHLQQSQLFSKIRY